MDDVAKDLDEVHIIDNIVDHLKIIRKYYWLIMTIIMGSVSITGFISLQQPDIYEAKAVIMPVASQPNQNGLANVDRQIGISMPAQSNAAELESLLNSNILMEKVVRNKEFYPIFLRETYDENPGHEQIWEGINILRDIYTVKYDQKKGLITLMVEYTKAKTTAAIINCILTELTNYMSSEAKRVAETNRKYLEGLIKNKADPLIEQKVYSLIARQIEISMMAEVKENFAFKILDPPRVPVNNVRPGVKKVLVMSFVLSLMGALFLVFVREAFLARKGSS